MALVGATIQLIKGTINTVQNGRKIAELEHLKKEQDLCSLLPVEKRASAYRALKQTEYLWLTTSNADWKQVAPVEKEMLAIMTEQIDEKRDELAARTATQLDIANMLLTIQRLSHDSAQNVAQLKTQTEQTANKQHKELSQEIDKLRRHIEYQAADFNQRLQRLMNIMTVIGLIAIGLLIYVVFL